MACHSWNHRRSPRHDASGLSREYAPGQRRLGAGHWRGGRRLPGPTFGIVGATAWAIDVLASAVPVRLVDIPGASRSLGIADAHVAVPARGPRPRSWNCPRRRCESPARTCRSAAAALRLLPSWLLNLALRRMAKKSRERLDGALLPPLGVRPGPPRLPLKALSRFRTYVGLRSSKAASVRW